MLDEPQLDALKVKHGKIAVIDYDGHQIVFRRPTRENCREYRRQRESPSEKHEAMEHLAQVTLVAFDGELDANKARTFYTATFLEEYPLFVNVPKVQNALSALSGMIEEEEAIDLGKGVSVRSARQRTSPTA
jgi:hypothetical protein